MDTMSAPARLILIDGSETQILSATSASLECQTVDDGCAICVLLSKGESRYKVELSPHVPAHMALRPGLIVSLSQVDVKNAGAIVRLSYGQKILTGIVSQEFWRLILPPLGG